MILFSTNNIPIDTMGNILTQERHNRAGQKFDDLKFSSQMQTTSKLALDYLNKAKDKGLIPPEYHNTEDFSKIFNGILYGGDNNSPQNRLGVEIYKYFQSGTVIDLNRDYQNSGVTPSDNTKVEVPPMVIPNYAE